MFLKSSSAKLKVFFQERISVHLSALSASYETEAGIKL